MDSLKQLISDIDFRLMLYKAYLSYIGSHEGDSYEDYYAPFYYYIKHVVGTPIRDWVEVKYLYETDYPKYVPMVTDVEVTIASGDNPLGIQCFEHLDKFKEIMEAKGIEGFGEKHIICWARCCLKTFFGNFGVNAKAFRDWFFIDKILPEHEKPSPKVVQQVARLLRKGMHLGNIWVELELEPSEILAAAYTLKPVEADKAA